MLVTEKEASERWCPFAKTQVLQTDTDGAVHGAAVNRTFLPAPSGNMSELVAGTQCIGSRCMAWRETSRQHTSECRQQPASNPAPGITVYPECICTPIPYGYCGAFGKVEQ